MSMERVPLHGRPPAAGPGRLATTMLEVLMAGVADGGRLRRGRDYARNGMVDGLWVGAGHLRGSVIGSRSYAYEVDVWTPVLDGAPADASALVLVPEADDLQFDCTCPDPDEPCKHAVAVVMAFAGAVGDRPELLRTWRLGPSGRAVVGSRARATSDSAAAQPKVAAHESPEWREFLGEDLPPAPVESSPPEVPVLGRELIGGIDLTAMVDSAREALAASLARPRTHLQ
jgi:uncharacterized Zn finger protein